MNLKVIITNDNSKNSTYSIKNYKNHFRRARGLSAGYLKTEFLSGARKCEHLQICVLGKTHISRASIYLRAGPVHRDGGLPKPSSGARKWCPHHGDPGGPGGGPKMGHFGGI